LPGADLNAQSGLSPFQRQDRALGPCGARHAAIGSADLATQGAWTHERYDERAK